MGNYYVGLFTESENVGKTLIYAIRYRLRAA
jgi:hypothetical protein